MVERQLPKLNVAGSIPVSRSKKISSLEELEQLYLCFDRIRVGSFERVDGWRTACHLRTSIDVRIHIERGAAQVGHEYHLSRTAWTLLR